jgi:hypothetical protein
MRAMSLQQTHHISQAIECELKAQDALDRGVRRYFARLARDYRRLADLAELPQREISPLPLSVSLPSFRGN